MVELRNLSKALATAFLMAPVFLPHAVAAGEAVPPPPPLPAALVVEGEDFKPQGKAAGWHVVKNGEGNYMVDIIGFNHISGERLLSADAHAKNASAVAKVMIPEAGTYRVWSRFEQPTNTENRFRVEVRQGGRTIGAAVMGEKTAPKYFFGSNTPVGQADPSWGSEGLVEQSFDIAGLQAGPAQITLIAGDQPEPAANRNVDFLFLTRDLQDTWRQRSKSSGMYTILDAALEALPTRYYVRFSSPQAQTLTLRETWNRANWNAPEPSIKLEAGVPSAWVPLRNQDVSHFTTLNVSGNALGGLQLHAELATDADGKHDAEGKHIVRALDWSDPKSDTLSLSLPPYPGKYPGERVQTVEEQYRDILQYLQAHPSPVTKEPTVPLAWGSYLPVWEQGRVADATADLYYALGLRVFGGFTAANGMKSTVDAVRQRFTQWGLTPNKTIAIGAYRNPPTPENIAAAKKAAEDAGVLPLVQRFDYGDEISFSEWLGPLKDDELKTRFAAWQQQHKGAVRFVTPDSSTQAAAANPELYVDSQHFYEDTAIDYVAAQAKEIPKAFGPDIHYGANVGAHPYYYPEIAKYIKWFRATPSGDYAANFGRHSEYFWQVGLPGPLIDGYVADHFRAGMRYNPQATLIQYTMPHSPGNSEADFRRAAFTHLAHGAHGLDYFGISLGASATENYIDFRDPARFAAIRDIDRSMATVEDILPASHVVPSKVALILSDSTERWDFAGIARDKANYSVFGDDYKQTRLAYHQERVGLYYALIHSSHPPDLVTEEDVQNGVLKDYDVAYWVGDCAEAGTVNALSAWVQAGGHLVATAGAMRYDEYHHALPSGMTLLGLQSATLEEKDRFFRPQIELPHLVPIDTIGTMPALAMRDTITPLPTAKIVAAFKSGAPAVVENTVGKGQTTYIATLPGVAYLWSAYQPAPGQPYFVPSRGPSSHMNLTRFSAETRNWIAAAANETATNVDAHGAWVDARLLQAPTGYAVPLANYSPDTAAPVTLTLHTPGPVASVTSASHGPLKLQRAADGSVTVNYAPGLGDILRVQ